MTPPRVAVIDYGIGNLRSAQKSLERAGATATLTSVPAEIAAADAVVLPGVGNVGRCLEALRATDLEQATLSAIDSGRPFLGICVGMQMLFAGSDEAPDVPGLGAIDGWVRLLPDTVKRPQMQWNRLNATSHRFMADLDGAWMYFVHSFAATEVPSEQVVATCDYGGPVVAAVAKGTVWATQFHPEKSGDAGAQLMGNFLASVAVNP